VRAANLSDAPLILRIFRYAKDKPILTHILQVRQHKSKADGIWMSYNGGVYDLTDFVDGHPGGDKILLAAGGPIEPFWRVYKNHDKQSVRDILNEKLIGRLDASSALLVQTTENQSSCPYANDPDRHPALRMHSAKPCNAEVPQSLMLDNWITPTDLWYVRNHHPVPDLDASTHQLELELGVCDAAAAEKQQQRILPHPVLKGHFFDPVSPKWRSSIKGGKTAELSVASAGVSVSLNLTDLQRRFETHTVTTTIQCGGNRRAGHNRC
jgi:cytochrome b involved in lipid metabolism